MRVSATLFFDWTGSTHGVFRLELACCNLFRVPERGDYSNVSLLDLELKVWFGILDGRRGP